MALPIWGYFMQKIYANPKLSITQKDKFVRPETMKDNFSCDDLAYYGAYDGDFPENGGYHNNPVEINESNKQGSINQNLRKKDSINFDR